MLRRAPGLRDHRRRHRRARHRRDDRGVLGHRLRAAPAAAVSRAGPAGAAVRDRRRPTPSWSCRRRTIATGKQASTVFESIGLHHGAAANLVGTGEPLRVEGTAVSADLFPTLRVQPLIGRLFTETDDRDGAPGTLILQLPALADAVRRRPVDRRPAGAARRRVVHRHRRHAAGVPLPDQRGRSTGRRCASTRRCTSTATTTGTTRVGRLRAGVTFEQAQAEMDVLAARSKQQYPGREQGRRRDARSGSSDERVAAVAAAALRAVGRRGVRAADRLRQPRQPAAGARARAAPRAGRAHRDGRRPRADDPAADDREPAARGRRRRARRGDRLRRGAAAEPAGADRRCRSRARRPSICASCCSRSRSPSSPAWPSAWRRCCASAAKPTSAACARARGRAAARRKACARRWSSSRSSRRSSCWCRPAC